MKIVMPSKFDRDSLPPLFERLDASRNDVSVTVDFSLLGFSTPTAILVAGAKLRAWVAYRFEKSLESIPEGISDKNRVHTYLMHIGFFSYIRIPIGKGIGEASGSKSYLPIKRISIPPFSSFKYGARSWHELIEEESSSLARVLVGDFNRTEEIKTYSYCLRELIRNVFEHSGADECFILGQRWRNGRAEIAVVDAGRGVYSSLSGVYDVRSDSQALDFALRPGVSRTLRLADEDNVFDNSGFGLYVLSSVAASFGWFAFGSGKARVIGYENTKRINQSFSFEGTFFGMHLNSAPGNFRSVLSDVIESGEEEAKLQGATRRASSLSKMY